MSTPRSVVPLSLLLLAASTGVQPKTDDALPHWMAGHWCAADQSGAEEFWLAPAGGLMPGLSRTVRQGRRTQFEFLRIEWVDEVPTYLAMPQGRPATAFGRTAGGENWIRFENPAHDFPRRIEYRRQGGHLLAEISGPGAAGSELSIGFDFIACTP